MPAFKQELYLKADNDQETDQNGLLSFVDISRSGIQILKRDKTFKVIEFSSFKLPISLNDATWSDNVSEIIFSSDFKSFTTNTETRFFISDSKVILVPASLYSDADRQKNFEFLFNHSEGCKIQEQRLSNSDTVGIIGIPQGIVAVVSKPIKSTYISWLDRLHANASNTQIQLVLDKKEFALVVFKNGKLVFSNWFEFIKSEDVLYYLMASLESLQILHSEANVVLNGKIEKGNSVFTTISKYISKLSFGKRPSNLTYSYSLKQQLPEHRFPFIFAASCA